MLTHLISRKQLQAEPVNTHTHIVCPHVPCPQTVMRCPRPSPAHLLWNSHCIYYWHFLFFFFFLVSISLLVAATAPNGDDDSNTMATHSSMCVSLFWGNSYTHTYATETNVIAFKKKKKTKNSRKLKKKNILRQSRIVVFLHRKIRNRKCRLFSVLLLLQLLPLKTLEPCRYNVFQGLPLEQQQRW